MIVTWWLSNRKMTVKVVVKDTMIIDAAPVVRKFIGQPFQNIVTWMNRIAPPAQWNYLNIKDDDGNLVKENSDFLPIK
ncbi:MAG: hypothetical protein ACYSUB_01915 [Planctomycetota bacterium]|jgi:hypothetical protein